MSDEYEYDTPSDPDEEPVYMETFWNEIQKRVKCIYLKEDVISIQLQKNDDISILADVLQVIKEGVSSDFIACRFQRELLHNAIISNPSMGIGRLQGINRLDKLSIECELLYLSHIHTLHIPTAGEYIELKDIPNLKAIHLDHPCTALLTNLQNMQTLEHISIAHARTIPSFCNCVHLKTLTLEDIHEFDNGRLHHVDIHIKNSTIQQWMALLLRRHPQITYTRVLIQTDNETITYETWVEQQPLVIRF
tara:strand:+ start:692 stop:1438 length:747 start_codon:yes stop_codon:yes gene_type:complete